MTEIRIDDPMLLDQKKISDDGRVYIGRKYAGKHVKVVVAEVDEEDLDDDSDEESEAEAGSGDEDAVDDEDE